MSIYAGLLGGAMGSVVVVSGVGGIGVFTAGLISNIMFGLTVAAAYHRFLTLSQPAAPGGR